MEDLPSMTHIFIFEGITSFTNQLYFMNGIGMIWVTQPVLAVIISLHDQNDSQVNNNNNQKKRIFGWIEN